MNTMLIFPVLSSSLGEVTRFMNETIIEAPKTEAFVNLTRSLPDYGSTCGVNFCSGSSAHVSIQKILYNKLKHQFEYYLYFDLPNHYIYFILKSDGTKS